MMLIPLAHAAAGDRRRPCEPPLPRVPIPRTHLVLLNHGLFSQGWSARVLPDLASAVLASPAAPGLAPQIEMLPLRLGGWPWWHWSAQPGLSSAPIPICRGSDLSRATHLILRSLNRATTP